MDDTRLKIIEQNINNILELKTLKDMTLEKTTNGYFLNSIDNNDIIRRIFAYTLSEIVIHLKYIYILEKQRKRNNM